MPNSVLPLFLVTLMAACVVPSDDQDKERTSVSAHAVSTPRCTLAPHGMIGWWPGDGNARDIVHRNDGVLFGGASFAPASGATATLTGKVDQAFIFNGTDAYVDLADDASVRGLNAFALDAWVNVSHSSDTQYIYSELGQIGGARVQFYVQGDTGKLVLDVKPYDDPYPGQDRVAAVSDEIVTPNEWVHVAGVWQTGKGVITAKVFVNGQETSVSASAIIGAPIVDTPPEAGVNYIGASRDGLGGTFRLLGMFAGGIDEVEFFRRALAPDEIRAIFMADAAGKCKRRKSVIFIAGILSSVTCKSRCACSSGTDLGGIKSALSEFGDPNSDVSDFNSIDLYSYNGGETKDGKWCPAAYGASDTSQDLGQSTRRLYDMLSDIDTQNGDTDFYVVGHSQGGLLAFQAIAATTVFQQGSKLKGIVTLDAPLGYLQRRLVRTVAVPSQVTLPIGLGWGEPAAHQMATYYDRARDHSRQGTTAQLLCGISSSGCPDEGFRHGITNGEAVRLNLSRPADTRVNVLTIGADHDDAVYDPRNACRIFLVGHIDDTSSQVVEGAAEVAFMGGNSPRPRRPVTWGTVAQAIGLFPPALSELSTAVRCVLNSHDAVLTKKASEVSRVVRGAGE